ncbi:MAG: 2-oxopent-4-enoate hydratase, partial [Candidatus Thiodiazotropha endolucinida]
MLNEQRIHELGDELFDALSQRHMIDPLTERETDITIEDAYHVSLRMVNRRVEHGESIIGKKIGVTSKAVQNMLNVHQPDIGYLTDRMVYGNGDEMPISKALIQPR